MAYTSSPSLMMETSSTKRQKLEILPTLPFDLVANIFSRLPVKPLLRLRCLSKSFNSLISDSKFAKDHLKSSTKHRHLMVCAGKLILFDSPMSSVFSTSTLTQSTPFKYPITPKNFVRGPPFGFSSCDGILCFAIDPCYGVLWNPSIRKFKLLPPLESFSKKIFLFSMYNFGYHHLRDIYMTIGISFCVKKQTEVSVNTMGTDYWRRIGDFPCHGYIYGTGVFLRDTVHWLTRAFGSSECAIVSLDLEKESYQKLYMPDLKKVNCSLGLVRGGLCISEWNDTFLNVWIMKEYENKESWTKLYNIPLMKDHVLISFGNDLYVSEDDQVLVKFYVYEMGYKKLKLFIYDSKNATWKIPEIQNINHHQTDSKVYIESLISPCS